MNYLDQLKKKSDSTAAPAPGAHRVVRDILPPTRSDAKKAIRLEKPEGAAKPSRGLALPNAIPTDDGVFVRETTPAMRRTEDDEKSVETRAKVAPPRTTATPAPEITITEWHPKSERTRRWGSRLTAIAVVLVLAAGFLIPTIVFPTLSITINPKILAAQITPTDFVADASLVNPDPVAKKLPAILISTDRTMQNTYPATGKKFVQTRAQGVVTIFNAFSSAPQTLVANTRFQDASGKVFRLVGSIVVPGAQVTEGKLAPASVQATVIADGFGDSYNSNPPELRIPGFRGSAKYDGFYARAAGAFSGGFEGQATVVLDDDLKKASEDITQKLYNQLKSDLQSKIPSGEDFMAPDGAREISVTRIDQPKAGEPRDTFSVSATGSARLAAFRKSHLNGILGALFIPPADLVGKLAATQNSIAIENAHFVHGQSQIAFTATGAIRLYRETNLDTLRDVLKTSTPRKAEAYLRSRNEIESFAIKRFPPWLWFVPSRSGGLQIARTQPD